MRQVNDFDRLGRGVARVIPFLGTVIALALTACGGAGAPPPTEPTPVVAPDQSSPIPATFAPTASPVPTADPPTQTPEPNATPLPVLVPDRLVIPAIGLDAPVVPAPLEIVTIDGQLVGQYKIPDYFGSGWHDGSATLGVPGNTVLGGHHNIHGEVFKRLVDLNLGDSITVHSGSRAFNYTVTDKMILPEKGQPLVVRLENAKWIDGSDDERLTLVTCWPYTNNTHRLVVVARPESSSR